MNFLRSCIGLFCFLVIVCSTSLDLGAQATPSSFKVEVDSLANTKTVRFPNGKTIVADLFVDQNNLIEATCIVVRSDSWITHFSWELDKGEIIEQRILYNDQGDTSCTLSFPRSLFFGYQGTVFSNGNWLQTHAVSDNRALDNRGISNIIMVDDQCRVLFDYSNCIHGKVSWQRIDRGGTDLIVAGGFLLENDWRRAVDESLPGTYLVFVFDKEGLLQSYSIQIPSASRAILQYSGLYFYYDEERDLILDASRYMGDGFKVTK